MKAIKSTSTSKAGNIKKRSGNLILPLLPGFNNCQEMLLLNGKQSTF